MELAKVTSKGQITLPIAIRRHLGLREGDKVAFVEQDGRYMLVNSSKLTFSIDDELDKADAAARHTRHNAHRNADDQTGEQRAHRSARI